MTKHTPIPQTVTPAKTSEPDCHTYDARALLEGGQRAWIRLDDQMYVLRITRANKLILTK
ncbi:MAG: hemin uptake protein HemP [Pseudomonadota bacterium]